MKKLLFLLLFLPFLGNSQATFTAPVGYNTGAPSATPSGVGTRWRFDLLTGKKYTWLPGTLSWDEDARGIDQVAGCSAPLYTPGYNQSTFAVNSCTVPELYQWTGAAWVRLNAGQTYTAGTGISIDGSNVITNTAPNIVQTLSISGQDLTLSGGGGTVEIPSGASDALGTGFTSGGGSGTIPDETLAAGNIGAWVSRLLFGLPSYYQDNIGDGFNTFGVESYDPISGASWFLGNTDDSPQEVILQYSDGSDITAALFLNQSGVGFTGNRAFIAGANSSILLESDDNITITAPLTTITGVTRLGRFTTTQRNAISSPATGYVIFCTDATATDSSTGVMQVYNGSVWKNAW